MATELYDLTAPVFTRGLKALSAILDKAVAHAEETGADAESYLALRLAPDMHPLSKQVQIACDGSKLCVARLSGVDAPVNEDSETTIVELQARIASTLDFIGSVPRDAIDGQEERDVVLKFPGGEWPFKGQGYVVGFALPNVFFHLSTAYGLLRQAGVPIGKRDFLGVPG
ncbi:DUF1993 domain-containing protein [Roseibacterium beibuensis]|uniref:DUF1993 domain-containing protein n=1 Tax=[Roseibacterium] beibuensis TaxID=1193142 RepID=UPI00217ED99C|nr:DUF1993 domain-containing protein [Roseibacterium beibuensis]MCS6627834.1 DUF1993 domain-containing protein [Roseibacterium beibuensis]